MSPKFQEIDRKWVKILVFLTHHWLPFKVPQSVSQKNRPDCAKSNWGLSFPGPFLLKPGPSQVSLGFWQLEMSSKCQEIERKWVKIQIFLTHPRVPFRVSQSVSCKNRPHRAKSNWGLSFPGPFLLKPRPSQVNLGFRQLGNVAQVPGNRAQVGQDPSLGNPPLGSF